MAAHGEGAGRASARHVLDPGHMRVRNGVLVGGFDGRFKGCAVPARDDCFYKSFISLGAGDPESEIGRACSATRKSEVGVCYSAWQGHLQTFLFFHLCNHSVFLYMHYRAIPTGVMH